SICAAPIDATTYNLVGDARRGGWYHAQVTDSHLVGEVTINSEDEMAAKMDARRDETWITFDESLNLGGTTIPAVCPTASKLAEVASRWNASDWDRHETAEPLQPIYLREAFITTPKRSHLVVTEPTP
ncbi:MAG: hypothetical protein KDK97_19130, partial [Verrucomicrobiales bacterium]|nr:hypothetical protein [Verrucomicrobiales bacterium]